MAEPFYMRAKRVVSAGIESALDQAERASGTSLMREAIREVDRAMDKVRREQEDATDRQNQAVGQQKLSAQRAEEWGGKVLFTLEKGREDLAEAAIMQQMDFEAKIKHFKNLEKSAKMDVSRLDRLLEELAARKMAMEDELAEFEKMMSENKAVSDEHMTSDPSVERKIKRAEETFERTMEMAGGVAGASKHAADIGKLQRNSEVEERLAALKKSMKSKSNKNK
ncbi:PspA/IM30 family protein [Parasphingorhabdus sp.]|uniref:PspA/IM30 family protein n=1 Tax=Parasphingorhabdus sp. TaxID=2709688 RepID=UPI002B266FA9|nr:PspA/IM30 family protein [Parasphingorhabdus sp.]